MINLKKQDPVADAVKDILQQEALKGNQKKIDKNHNNKIDGEDFKILRGEKKANEEVEQIDEDMMGYKARQKHESKWRIHSPEGKHIGDVTKHENGWQYHAGHHSKWDGSEDSPHYKTGVEKTRAAASSKVASIHKASLSESVEQIDELSKSTLGSYVKSAARDVGASRKLSADFKNQADKAKKPSNKAASKRLSDKFMATAQKRHAGIGKAVERLTKEENEVPTQKTLRQFKEGWQDMLDDVKKRAEPKPNGGSGVKQGSRYGGSKQKDEPEKDNDEKK